MILILYWNKNRQQVLKKKKRFSKPVRSLLSGVWYLCVLDFSKTLNLKLLMAPSTLSHNQHMFWEWNWVRESGNEHGLGSMTQRAWDFWMWLFFKVLFTHKCIKIIFFLFFKNYILILAHQNDLKTPKKY